MAKPGVPVPLHREHGPRQVTEVSKAKGDPRFLANYNAARAVCFSSDEFISIMRFLQMPEKNYFRR